MKNEMIVNASGGLELLSSIDNGDNLFILNGTVINPIDWIGSGNYTFTINGITYTIAKADSQGGNWQLIQDTDFTYHFQNARSKTQEIIDLIYPVGSIYMSVNAVNPSAIFGGTWEQIKDRFLLSAGDNYNNGDKDGAATVKLKAAESGNQSQSITSGGMSANESHGHGINSDATNASFMGMAGTGATSGLGELAKVATTGTRTQVVPSAAANTDFIRIVNTKTVSTAHTHSVTVAAKDATSAHNNMPPYLVVNIWKRTA